MPLTIKLDDKEFTFSDKCLEAMATTLWRTKVKERGFMFCSESVGVKRVNLFGEITPGKEHIGGRGSIGVRNCKEQREGHYHTHPVGDTSPSYADALSIISMSILRERPMLGCRGAKKDENIRCDTVTELPPKDVYLRLKRKASRITSPELDPETWKYFATPYNIPVRKIPEIIRPPALPPVAPRIKTEQFSFAGSGFMKYTNLDTGEERLEKVY